MQVVYSRVWWKEVEEIVWEEVKGEVVLGRVAGRVSKAADRAGCSVRVE